MNGRPVVVRDIIRADPGVVARLRAVGVATTHEAAGRSGLLDHRLRAICPGSVVAAPAVTALCHASDNLMIHLAVECRRRGDILVVAVTSECTDGYLGELLATSLHAHGVIGAVIDAGVRDVALLREMEFPVWARAVSAQGTAKASPGSVNVPVVCAGRLVEPGDVIVADDDGVVRVPAREAAEVAERAEERVRREKGIRRQLADGALGADIYGFRDLASRLGITFAKQEPRSEEQ
jgi:4-hydroxy-4-methyl-2-oxoglutarate aldolase